MTGYAHCTACIVAIKRKWLVKTEREEKAAWRPPPVLYDRVVSNSDLGNNFLKLLGNQTSDNLWATFAFWGNF